MVKLLLARNAELTLADNDGCAPKDISSDDMKALLQTGCIGGSN
jgi:hypothetical protein